MNIDLSAGESAKVESLARKWGRPKEEVLLELVKNGLRSYDIREPWWRNFYLLGAPWGESRKSKFVDDLRRRFRNTPKGLEEAFKYIDIVTDRIIGKGVGLLQFNALLSALLVWAFEHYAKNVMEHWVLVFSLMFSGISSLLMILLIEAHPVVPG
jgi:hypothetical protein